MSGAERRIDLNSDMGEGFGAWSMGSDEELLGLVTSTNLACGFHAGDPAVMDRLVALAARAGVAIGAHPGHHDLRGFGRRAIHADPRELESDIVYQVGALDAFARSHGVRLVHVKAHGALYNQAVADAALAAAIARGIARAGRELVMVGLAGSATMRRAAEQNGLRYAAEAFADRAYNPDGTLMSRKLPGSVFHDPARVAQQAVDIARDGCVIAADGTRLELLADTLCLHGDNPSAVANALAVRAALTTAGVTLAPLAR